MMLLLRVVEIPQSYNCIDQAKGISEVKLLLEKLQ